MKFLIDHKWKLLFLLSGLVFLHWPGLDLAVSRHFFQPGEGFYLRNRPLAVMVYRFINIIDMPLLAGLLALAVISLNPALGWLHRGRRRIAYLLLVYVLGPGLVVNVLLKDHMGRARPHSIEAFGGHALFTPALVPSHECRRNCAFVSGHASMGFYLVCLGFAFPSRRRFWLATGIVAGALVGYVRIIQGAHFLSDVVFAFFAVYAVAAITYDFVLKRETESADTVPR
jgi:lipid A 4'-phosphatase